MTFKELQAWKKQIVEDQLGWITKVKKVTEPAILEAYEAGLKEGMNEILEKLHNIIEVDFS